MRRRTRYLFALLALALTGPMTRAASVHEAGTPLEKIVRGATPFLALGGEIVAMDAFNASALTNAVTREEFRKAASNGVEMIFLRGVCVSRNTGDGWFGLDANILDRAMAETLADNPSARIVLNIGGLHPPGTWYAFHSQEPKLQDIDGNRSVFPDPNSPIYRAASMRYISNLVAYVEGQPYADAVAGYHISVFEGGEWMMPPGYWGYSTATRTAFQSWLEERYGTVAALETAWGANGIGSFASVAVPAPAEFAAADLGPFRDPALRRPVTDFAEFWQQAGADCLLAFCRAAKEASARDVKPLVGAFYGYILETSQTFYKGHHALRVVLDSPWIDFLAAPYSYVYRSPAWLGVDGADIGAGMFHGPVDSILANGKLFWTEDDSRTHLTDDDAKSHFTNEADTIANLRRNQLASLARGAGIWRLDLYGTGWYDSDGLMQELGLQRIVNEGIVRGADYAAGYAPEVALIIDEESSLHVATRSVADAGPRVSVSMFLRDHLSRAGVSYGVYLLSDLVAGRVPDCSAYLFAGTYRVTGAERNWIDANLKRDGKTLVWLYGSGLYDESGWGLGRMGGLVGFDIAQAPDPAPSGIEPSAALIAAMGDAAWNNPGITGHPEWYVQNVGTGAQVLANYVHGGTRRPAIVMEDKGDWTSVQVGALRLDARWLLGLVRLAGIPQVLETDATVPVYAGHGVIGIWPTTHMAGTVRLKEPSDVYDLHTGSLLHQGADRFPVNLAQWQVAGYKIQPVGVAWLPGLFFEWQSGHFQPSEITGGLADAEEDADGDGASNDHEFIAGSDPRDPLSRFTLAALLPEGASSILLSYDTATNRNYLLQVCTNLADGSWMAVATNPGTGDGASVAVPTAAPAAFFRLEAELP